MNVVVTGVTGQLGFDVCAELNRRGHSVVPARRPDFDLTRPETILGFIGSARPDAVVHCAAYTAVDKAEDEPELCKRVNAEGTREVARACAGCGAKMVYVSTDYVFSGEGNEPYETDEPPAPLNVYGRSKYEGELAVRGLLERYFIVRTSWVCGLNGKNFVKTMLRLGESRDEIGVVNDQIGSPTFTADLAPLLCDMVESDRYGTYHATNEGFCSWAEFASEIFAQAGMKTRVRPIATSEYPTKARRPLNSRLSKRSLDRAGFARLPRWEDALRRFLAACDPA